MRSFVWLCLAEGSLIPAVCYSCVCGGFRKQIYSGAEQRSVCASLTVFLMWMQWQYRSLSLCFCRVESSEKQKVLGLCQRAEYPHKGQASDSRAAASVRPRKHTDRWWRVFFLLLIWCARCLPSSFCVCRSNCGFALDTNWAPFVCNWYHMLPLFSCREKLTAATKRWAFSSGVCLSWKPRATCLKYQPLSSACPDQTSLWLLSLLLVTHSTLLQR